ncbi:unnamed protein product [Caenorhabditis sp. 36 PRJEB53466]|nr:unnamed protein product [Caenorhabditis sp. 36 PRJEB53466]
MFVDIKSKSLKATFEFVIRAVAFLILFYFLKRRIKTNKLERRLRLLERKHENEWILLEPTHFLSKLDAMRCPSAECDEE